MGTALIVLSVGLVASAGTAVAMAVRVGNFQARVARLISTQEKLGDALKKSEDEFSTYRARANGQLKLLRDSINELEEHLATTGDPASLRDRFSKLLQKATGSDGGSDTGGELHTDSGTTTGATNQPSGQPAAGGVPVGDGLLAPSTGSEPLNMD